MTLTILGSESLGNCYLLTTDTGQTLILEAGIRVDQVKHALDYDLSNVVGCLVTHQHGDHAKYVRDYAKAGIDIYMHKDTFSALGVVNHRINVFNDNSLLNLLPFAVRPFAVPHGVTCHGFLINHPESGKILFVTDASHIPHRFSGLTHLCIEANYSDEAMVSDRQVGHHMALDTALSFVKDNEPHNVRNIVLLHLSASNSDAMQFTKSVQEVAPHAVVTIADKGVTVNLNKTPF